MSESFPLIVAMALLTAIAGLVSLLIYRGINKSGKTFMTKMKLHPDETYREFQALAIAHIIQTIGLFIMGVGVVIGYKEPSIFTGRVSTLIQGAITMSVMAKWFRRHKR